MNAEFAPGARATWIYWPPDARYRMAVHVDVEIVRFTNTKIVVRCWDRRGKEHIRHVNAGSLLAGDWPHYVYANGYYPVKGDAPEYKKNEGRP